MAEGFRVTEDGSLRVTESLDLRITEQYAPLYASSSLDAAGTQVFVAGTLLGASSDLVGSLSQLAAEVFTAGAVVSVSASGAITGNAEWYKNFQSGLITIANMVPKAGYLLDVSASSSSAASIGLLPDLIRNVGSSLNGSSSTTSIAAVSLGANSSMSSVVSLNVTPSFIASARFAGVGSGAAVPQGVVTRNAGSNLQGNASLLIYPLLIQAAASLSGGTGIVNAYGGFLASGEVNSNSNGLLNGNIEMILNAIVSSEPLRRVTESGDPRIIHTGEFREAYGINNLVTGIVSSTPGTTPFAGQLYAHRNGGYKLVSPSVKHNGSWVVPKVYVKDNGTWKRVF